MTITLRDVISDDIMTQLREDFLATSLERLETLDQCIVSLLSSDGDDTDHLVEFQREIHSLKGVGGTLGFHSISLISHRLEDYLIAAGSLTEKHLGDLQIFVDRLSDIINIGVEPAEESVKEILRALPVFTSFDPSEVVQRNVEVLLMIPSRAIRAAISRELQACGYRVITAQTPSMAFDMVIMMRPDMIITSAVLDPISGIDLVRVFASMAHSENIPIAVLTSFSNKHHTFKRLPEGTAIIRLNDHLKDDLANMIVDFELQLEKTTVAAAN